MTEELNKTLDELSEDEMLLALSEALDEHVPNEKNEKNEKTEKKIGFSIDEADKLTTIEHLFSAVLTALVERRGVLDFTSLAHEMTGYEGGPCKVRVMNHYRAVGRDLLERMSKAGLVERDKNGWWRLKQENSDA